MQTQFFLNVFLKFIVGHLPEIVDLTIVVLCGYHVIGRSYQSCNQQWNINIPAEFPLFLSLVYEAANQFLVTLFHFKDEFACNTSMVDHLLPCHNA